MAGVEISQKRARIFRVTHIANLPWILENGLQCKSSGIADPHFESIGNTELIQKRTTRYVPVEPGGTLSDYIPFYFTPFSMMMYNIKTGYGEVRHVPNKDLVLLVSSINILEERGAQFVFTDRHAYLKTAEFFNSREHLDRIDWNLLQSRDFQRDPNDPGKTDRYQAEALVYGSMSMQDLQGIVCYGKNEGRTVMQNVTQRGLETKVVARPHWFF